MGSTFNETQRLTVNMIRISMIVAGVVCVTALAACDQNRSSANVGANERADQRADNAGAMDKQADRAAAFIADATITTKLKAQIVKDDALKLSQIDVTTTQGVVRLSGAVDTPAAVARAEELAHTIEGVKRVDNALVAKPAT
jgi:hyperosmotically inducible periplasmic protein